MNRDEILSMPAGQEMDLLVAEKVLKLDAEEWNKRFFNHRTKFSTDISAAWDVVEKFRKEDYDIEVKNSIHIWSCILGQFVGHGETAPLAICRAALLATMG